MWHFSRTMAINRIPLGSRILSFILITAVGVVARAQQVAPYFLGDRILIDATIDQQPARFMFDTGASFSTMFGAAAERLGVEVESIREEAIANHPVEVGISKPLEFGMFGQQLKTPARVLMVRGPAGIDGVLGWRSLSSPILLIDGYERRLATPKQLPSEGWQRWQMDKETSQLFFVVTKDGKPFGRVFVDTGAVCGLRLSPPLWKAWRQQQPEAVVTLETFRYTVGETMVHEMAWAEDYSLGDLLIRQTDIGPIPDCQGDQAIDAEGKPYIATLGIRALRNLRMIVSRRTDEVLTQSVPLVPDHNRLGAVFVRDSEQASAYVAHVLDAGPAGRGGLNNGDVLLEINGIDFTDPQAAPGRSPASFCSKPAGTRLEIKVQREGTIREFSIVLQDLLP